MRVDIWSDVVCPWCSIAKRRFDAAVAEVGLDVDVRARAFQLDPSAPPGTTTTVLEAYEQKFGGADRSRHLVDKLTAAAAAEGIEFHLDRALRANTFTAHRLIWWAGRPGNDLDQDAVNAALMEAHFRDGRNIADTEVLADVAVTLGADRDGVEAFLAGDGGVSAVDDDLEEAADRGITAVPTFVVDNTWAVPGAQDRDVFVKVLRKLAAKTASV